MEKFAFLLGDWELQYIIPESRFSHKTTGSGFGSFKRKLNNEFVFFDYESNIDGNVGQAHGIFGFDQKVKIYRYWWFESSGNFMQASCNFTDENTLNMNWHDSLLTQYFKRNNENEIELKMSQQNSIGGSDLILEVKLLRRNNKN